ncbi:unnamed protein product [Paramecium sonneborni]|uniref:Uncharacterized protein n=1 Tax=Paramecium sonneborni TaxID=65129 RepID=A0A8S1R7Z5_9CILI|nr:unnamed protein product [Paramecium sonneborni]
MQQLFDLKITKLVTLQVPEKIYKKRKHFNQNRISLWTSFHDIWTPSGKQFNFQPFKIKEQQLNQIQTRRKSQQLSNQISRIQQSIDYKQKILEDIFMPKKVKPSSHNVQIKDPPQQRRSLSILYSKRPESHIQTQRTQSATPIMRRSKKHQKAIEIKDTIGLQIEKCLLYDRYQKEKIKLDYTNVSFRRQKQNIESHSFNNNKVQYKHSITLAKWDQSEKSYEQF